MVFFIKDKLQQATLIKGRTTFKGIGSQLCLIGSQIGKSCALNTALHTFKA